MKWPKLSQQPVGKLARGESEYLGMAEIELDRKSPMKKANRGGMMFREKLKCKILESKDNSPTREKGHYCHERTGAALGGW